jgi:hypothetical protein
MLDLLYALQRWRGRRHSLRSGGGLDDAQRGDGAQGQDGVHHETKAMPHLSALHLVWPGIPPSFPIAGRIRGFTFKPAKTPGSGRAAGPRAGC